jgi:hypothetical protein
LKRRESLKLRAIDDLAQMKNCHHLAALLLSWKPAKTFTKCLLCQLRAEGVPKAI